MWWSRVNGTVRSRTPVASKTALASAAPTGVHAASPAPSGGSEHLWNIAPVTDEAIYIGADKPSAMPVDDFTKLLDSFPNSTELDRYADARVARLAGDYFETTSPAEKRFEEYLRRHSCSGLTVKITNPKAIVIAGRSNGLSAQQLFDFELVKRKYADIVDILSYDDLLNRLSRIIEKFRAST